MAEITAQSFYARLDKAVRKASCRNASRSPVDGFPYLRTDRFLASLKNKASDEGLLELWIELLRKMDLEERKKEIANLPEEAVSKLSSSFGESWDKPTLLTKLPEFSEDFLKVDKQDPLFYTAVKNAVRPPEVYSSFMRTLGVYPIASLFVALGTKLAYKTFKEWYQKKVEELPVRGKVVTLALEGGEDYSHERLFEIFTEAWENALGIPMLSDQQVKEVAHILAPVLKIDVADEYDRLGRVKWEDGKVKIDGDEPALYYYSTFTVIKGKPHFQINYAFWYSGRYGPEASFIEKGPLDGMTVRVTLTGKGEPIMVDAMNNCGCYFFYLPRKERILKEKPNHYGLYPFVPGYLAEDFPSEPLSLRINSGWHQVQHVSTEEAPDDTLEYKLIPYEELEILPHSDKQTESVFTKDGIMKDSWRIEPVIFFSVGIPKVGYMRQRGNHAIKLVGHAHFTDPNLYEKDFVFK